MARIKLDEAAVRNATRQGGKIQTIYWDTKFPGFGLLVGATTKTFIYQRDLPGNKTRRVSLGRYPQTLTLAAARKAAARYSVQMLDGIDPSAQRRERVKEQQLLAWQTYTFQESRDHHILEMMAKRCSQRSIDDLVKCTDRHLFDWLNRSLANIRPADTIERHRMLTVNSGPVAANAVFRQFRACYNAARRIYRELPECPANAIVYNAQHRRREPIVDFATWHAKVQSIRNPVRRDYHMLVALTGLRATDAKTVRFSEVDWDKGTLTRPNPKGGAKYAFTIPLSQYVLAMLARRKVENENLYNGSEWVFPVINRLGQVTHMQEPKEQRYSKDDQGKTKKIGFLPGPHRLRDSFITTCATEANIDPITIKCLVNHRLPSGDVTTGYVRPSVDHMRACLERVTAILLGKMGLSFTL